jgi:hypothetical protein
MKKKIFPIAVALAVSAMFILPGLAFGKGGGTPNPPPSNPPCDSDGHNGLAPPYGGPFLNSHLCKHGTGNATGNATGGSTGNSTGNACPPNSKNPNGTPPDCGHGTTGTTTGGTTTTGTTTGGATLNECTWDVSLGGTTIISDSEVPGLVGVHAEIPPDPTTHTPSSLVHGCLGVGSVVNPTPTPCPTGTAPIELQTDESSYVLLCVLL